MTKVLTDEAARLHAFPVGAEKIFLAHAAVTVLPRCVAEAMADYAMQSARMPQEFGDVLRDFRTTRELAATLIGARWQEIALLGPTSLGLSLFANGIQWNPGDEVVCYADDYPANVYPWLELERRGVVVRRLRTEVPGEVTPALVEAALTPRTRLVALASCAYLVAAAQTSIGSDALSRILVGVMTGIGFIGADDHVDVQAVLATFQCFDQQRLRFQ